MKEIFKSIGMLSENRVTVLIEGETGTGKELIAKAIHSFSPSRTEPFLAINCSAIVDTLMESELFGHEKGAFTGALTAKKGKFELAGSGMIFLDEIGEIPVELQAKLLRVLQEKEFQRVGGEKTLKSHARVVAATNRDLWKMAEEGGFREDLYYRLSIARIHVPPLRERKDDIVLLVDHLLRRINQELGKNIGRVEPKAMVRMKEYRWPGNVRQLENVLTRAAIYTPGEVILDDTITNFLNDATFPAEQQAQPVLSLREVEKEHIAKILDHTNWHITKTAAMLGISRPTLRLKIKDYQITRR
jgi:two-component system response regulator AtoC